MPRDFGRGRSGVPRQWRRAEGHTGAAALARQSWPPRGHRPRACAETFRTGTGRSRVLLGHAVRREPHQSATWKPRGGGRGRRGGGGGGGGGGGRRTRAKGNANAAHTRRTPSRPYDVHSALDGIRQTAKGDRQARFTTLMHHVHAVERLQAAYFALKRDAAAGVDGMTWHTYGQDLAHNLQELSGRLARGGYHAKPVKRVYIDKADGSKRPLGVPALEDKIVQRAAVEVLNAIYEQDFLGFSYGFRPGK